jgi:putative PIN family toxin of toxin-antitoxin system
VRLVLDTDVVVAAMRSPGGASAGILRAVRDGRAVALASVALALEYEAVCRRSEPRIASGLAPGDVEIFVDAVIAMAEPVRSHFLWRPQLRDPNDEMVLEAAVNGRAQALVTLNARHFVEVARFGIEVMPPREAVQRILR